jgi:hypothetical protein
MNRNDWDEYLDQPERYGIVMDNDGWWFKDKLDEEAEWFGGGEGPYGLDLLEHLLEKLGNEMEHV